jgi:hypothetical protein
VETLEKAGVSKTAVKDAVQEPQSSRSKICTLAGIETPSTGKREPGGGLKK